MIRRTVLVAAAAAALILAPTAAMAYDAPGYTSTVSDSTPASGSPCTVVISGGEANEPVTLTITSNPASLSNDTIQIAGTKSLTKTANASGVASFSVTLSGAGGFALTATNAAGAVLSTQSLTVGTAGAASGAVTGARLARTGFEGMPLVVGGGVLVLLGAGAVVITRRRRSAQVPA
jgi:hypothetical protein